MQLQELQKLLEIKQSYPDEEFLAANVLAKDPSNLKEAVAIDRGKRDGLREGMVVVTEGHSVVGTVTHIFDSYAWVTLITDPNSAISAMVQESRAHGVVDRQLQPQALDRVRRAGRGRERRRRRHHLGHRRAVPCGLRDREGHGGRRHGAGPVQEGTLEPLASLSHLETVLVLTSFLPRDLETAP